MTIKTSSTKSIARSSNGSLMTSGRRSVSIFTMVQDRKGRKRLFAPEARPVILARAIPSRPVGMGMHTLVERNHFRQGSNAPSKDMTRPANVIGLRGTTHSWESSRVAPFRSNWCETTHRFALGCLEQEW
eukprot:5124995-Amphidinium_carterae.1